MTPNLLHIEDPPRPEATPLWVEIPVNAATAPYLVSRASSDALTMWIPRSTDGKVRAAARETSLEALYQEVVQQVAARGREEGWENSHPLTKDGILQAIEHLRYYGFSEEEIEILAHPKLSWSSVDASWQEPSGDYMVLGVSGLRVQPAAWLDLDTVVIVPRDRKFLGVLLKFETCLVAAIHNAARGMALATRK